MPSPYATDEDSKSLWVEQSNYIATHIAAIAYGFHTTLFSAIVYLMFRSTPARRRDRRWAGWLVLSSAFWIAGTVHLACGIGYNEAAWISERGYPGGPLAFLTQQQTRPISSVESAAYVVASVLAEGLLLYRVFILWNRKWYIVLPLGLFYITTIVLTILRVAQLHMAHPPHIVDLGVITWTSLMAINIALSGMIALRILLMRRSIGRLLGREHADVYTGAAALVIETALPFLIISLVLLVLFGGRNTSQYLFLPLLAQTTCIAPLLIILRMFLNIAWSSNTAVLHDQGPATSRTTPGIALKPLTFAVTASGVSSEEVDAESRVSPLRKNGREKVAPWEHE